MITALRTASSFIPASVSGDHGHPLSMVHFSVKKLFTMLLTACLFAVRSHAQIYDTNGAYVQTFVGSGFYGHVDGQGQQTMFYNPLFIAPDSKSNLFVWESGNGMIRQITLDGTVTTFAGGGTSIVGIGTNVNLNYDFPPAIYGMTIDRTDTIWLASGYGYLYKITPDATVSKIQLPQGTSPRGICSDSLNNIYFSDSSRRIFKNSKNGTLSVFAGSGNSGYVDGTGLFCAFSTPTTMTCDSANSLYVFDDINYLIRKIDQAQNVTTLAGQYQNITEFDGRGTNTGIFYDNAMCFDGTGNLIFTCGPTGFAVRKIDPLTNITTIAGDFTSDAYTNGPGILARFDGADGVCRIGSTLYVADTQNQRIRQITFNPQPQLVPPSNLSLSNYPGIKIIGTVGRTYQIQSSPNMSNWITETTIFLNASPFLWIDQNTTVLNKFYRAVMLP